MFVCSMYVCVRLCRPRVKDPWRSMWSLCLVGVIQIPCHGLLALLMSVLLGELLFYIVCRKCTVEKLSIMVGFYTLFLAHDILLALAFGTRNESVQCSADMTRDQPQRGSMHIPTVAFYHFDSMHFTPCMTQSFFSFLLISRSVGMEIIDGLALIVTERKNWRERGWWRKVRWLKCSLCCPLSLSPLTLSSAFDQLQVQPRLWYPSITVQRQMLALHPLNTSFGSNISVRLRIFQQMILGRLILKMQPTDWPKFSSVRQIFSYNLSCEVWWVGGLRIPRLNQMFILVDCLYY